MSYPYILISEAEFSLFKLWIYDLAGIDLKETKLKLVEGRLAPRLRHYNLNSYRAYFQIITQKNATAEAQIAVDLLTTNETYFFREPKHFDFLKNKLLVANNIKGEFRIWCAASSTGEEPYTLAMLIEEYLPSKYWSMIASDINLQVLATASQGHYDLTRAHNIPKNLLFKYCLKGIGSQQGTFLIDRYLRDKIQFNQVNLVETLPEMGLFDVIFLRNVMIYFNDETRRQVVHNICQKLKLGGHLFVSHSESLVGISAHLKMVQPSVFIKI